MSTPATPSLSETNGTIAGQVTTDNLTSINFGGRDLPNLVPANNPIAIGNMSFAKWIRVHMAIVDTTISNLKAWKSSGAYVTGEEIFANTNAAYSSSQSFINAYGHAMALASSVVLSTMPTNDTGGGRPASVWQGTGAPNFPPFSYSNLDIITTTPGAENIWIGGAAGGSLNATGYSDYWVMQTCTTSLSPLGPVNQKSFIIQYTET